MNIEQSVLENLQKLSRDKQQEVLEFTELLASKTFLTSPASNLTPEQRAAHWISWVKSHSSNSPGLPDGATHRDSMYD
jgi:hypothetical protein